MLINLFRVVLVATLLTSCAIVDTGHRALRVRFGEVIGEPIKEGIVSFNPMTDTIIEFETRTKKLQDKAVTYTKDVQKVSVEYAVNFNLRPDLVGQVYKETGTDYENILLLPLLGGVLKDTVGKWDAVDLNAERERASGEILTRLQPLLAAKGITLSDFQIMGLNFDKEFENAVERKVTAIQRAQEAENKTRQIEEESKQKIITAQAEAEAMRIKTQALSTNPTLVQYEAVQKWDGKLPTQMVPNGAVPFIKL
jgi:regulator of protease activity HflC (stomatin/prohibitin superfamily)